MMKLTSRCAIALALTGATTLALAQNVAVVNGKAIPQARLDALITQMTRGGQQPKTPEMESRAKEEVVMREILEQEAERRGIAGTDGYKQQLELARQSILINELIADQRKKSEISEADLKTEYEKIVKTQGTAAAGGTEYRARHILVEKEDQAKKVLAELKKGGKFDELAKKHSKDPGSAARGGDLDFAKPETFVPEFGNAMKALKKGQMTETPVKTQFGYHIIRLDDTRESQPPAFDAVKPQVRQRLEQQRMQTFIDGLKTAAKTDFKFTTPPVQQ
jgi:peptidyl-prolyl cis-trans isomerase C